MLNSGLVVEKIDVSRKANDPFALEPPSTHSEGSLEYGTVASLTDRHRNALDVQNVNVQSNTQTM